MRGFIVVWLAAFGIVTMAASGITYVVARSTPSAPLPPRQAISFESDASTIPAHGPADALEIVSLRLPVDATGDQARRKLQSAVIYPYSTPQHWRVCLDDACWIAHGPGRYAEPENDAARTLEARAPTAPR
ncbi:MAG: hypothetical protein IT306_03625 [Chloroflexi bacterium]|nr:hypothetical protein [Chloroflexota bacterium]